MLDASPHSPFPYREGNSIRFLVDGEQFYPTMLKSIQQAQKYILMEMYYLSQVKSQINLSICLLRRFSVV